MPAAEPPPVRLLYGHNEEPLLMVRGDDPATILDTAGRHAADLGVVLIDAFCNPKVDAIRATPCRPAGHTVDGWDCDGGMTAHYNYGKPGPGAFTGAFIAVRPMNLDERKAAIVAELNAATVEEWNTSHPVGTPVRYWTWTREGDGQVGETRSAARLLGGNTPVVWVTGHPACITLTHVAPLQEEQ